MGPAKTISTDSTKRYLVYDENGTITSYQVGPMDPKWTTLDEVPQLTLTFPATFPSGKTPDEELGDGCVIGVEVRAYNSAGTSGPVTKYIQPEDLPVPRPYLEGMTTLYTGNSSVQQIINGIDISTNGGMVWCKRRPESASHALYDTERGAGVYISTGGNDPQNNSAFNTLSSFNTDGFEVSTSDGNYADLTNEAGKAVVAWTFEKFPGYFDVVKYTGNGSQPGIQTVPHSLGIKPGCIIIKSLTQNGQWMTWHTALSSLQHHLELNGVGPEDIVGGGSGGTEFPWGNTEPDATNFYLGGNQSGYSQVYNVNRIGDDYIAYVFPENGDWCKCGSYVGNGSSQIIDTGFKPQWLLIRRVNSTFSSNWDIYDSKRGLPTFPVQDTNNNPVIYANDAGQEQLEDSAVFVNDSGFQMIPGNQIANTAGITFAYIAIAEPPAARSMTQDELDAQKLLFGTYRNRKMVECGARAAEERATLRNLLKTQGYTDADLDALFGAS